MQHFVPSLNAGRLPSFGVLESVCLEDELRHGAWQILGGEKLGVPRPSSLQDVHFTILKGIPVASLLRLTRTIPALKRSDVAAVLGISASTLGRQESTPSRIMPVRLASVTWRFAELFALAVHIMGSAETAQRWLIRPAVGLDGRRPIDMLRTVQGAEVVEEFLMRLEYGVYT